MSKELPCFLCGYGRKGEGEGGGGKWDWYITNVKKNFKLLHPVSCCKSFSSRMPFGVGGAGAGQKKKEKKRSIENTLV